MGLSPDLGSGSETRWRLGAVERFVGSLRLSTDAIYETMTANYNGKHDAKYTFALEPTLVSFIVAPMKMIRRRNRTNSPSYLGMLDCCYGGGSEWHA